MLSSPAREHATPMDLTTLSSFPLFSGLEAPALAELVSSGHVHEVQSGDAVFRQGTPGSEVFVLIEGHVEVTAEADGGSQVLALLDRGAVVGEIAFLTGAERTATVVALGRARLWGLSLQTYERMRREGRPGAAHLAHHLAEALARRLLSTNRLMLETVLGDAARDQEPPPVSPSVPHLGADRVRVAPKLRLGDLQDLVEGKVLALRVPNYYTPRLCEDLCRRLLRHPGFARYLLAPEVGVQRIGMTIFETQSQPELLERYYREAQPTIESVRRLCSPLMPPVDRLRLELEELWPSGANIEQFHGRKMLVGVARMFEDSHALPPHQDMLERDLPDAPAAREILNQVTANLYLRLARTGGEVELWQACPTAEEARSLYTGQHDFYDRGRIPPPDVRLRPDQGDLVLWCADRIHAVLPSQGGPRVTASCFIGYRGPEFPLTLWS